MSVTICADIFQALKRSYDASSHMYNKPYTVKFKTRAKADDDDTDTGTNEYSKTAYLPAPSFTSVRVEGILTISKNGEVLNFDYCNESTYKLMPKQLCPGGAVISKPNGAVFAKLRFIAPEWLLNNQFYDMFDKYVATGANIPEVVKIIFDYYKKGTILGDIRSYFSSEIRNLTAEKADIIEQIKGVKKAKTAQEKAIKAGETLETVVDYATMLKELEVKQEAIKSVKGKVLTDNSVIYIAVDGFEDIETDTEYIAFCQDYVNFINRENKTVVRDVCMTSGEVTDCILVGDSKSKDEDVKNGYLPLFPYQTAAKIISKADSSKFSGNLRYKFRCKSAMESISIGYELYTGVLAMFSFLLKLYGNSDYLCWALNDPKKALALGMQMPEYEDDFGSLDAEIDVDTSCVPSGLVEKFTSMIKSSVNKYPFSDDDTLVVISPVIGQGRVTFRDFSTIQGSIFRKNMAYWFSHSSVIRGNSIRSPYMFEMIDALAYTKGAYSKKGLLYQSWRNDLITAMFNCKPIPTNIMLQVMTNARKSSLGLYKPETDGTTRSGADFETRDYNFLATVSAMLRYNLSFKEDEDYMVLNEEITDRSYLFARLLAFYDYMERQALLARIPEKERNTPDAKKKYNAFTTNAQRFSSKFLQAPVATEALLYNKLVTGHFRKLDGRKVAWFESERSKIYALFNEGDFTNRPLGDKWLLGYTLQKAAFYTKRVKTEGEATDDIGAEPVEE